MNVSGLETEEHTTRLPLTLPFKFQLSPAGFWKKEMAENSKMRALAESWKVGILYCQLKKRPQCYRSRIASRPCPLCPLWSIGVDCLGRCKERGSYKACSGAMWLINNIFQVFGIKEWQPVWRMFVDFALRTRYVGSRNDTSLKN